MPIKNFNKHVKQLKLKDEEIGNEKDSRNCLVIALEEVNKSNRHSKCAKFKMTDNNSANSNEEAKRDEHTSIQEIANEIERLVC